MLWLPRLVCCSSSCCCFCCCGSGGECFRERTRRGCAQGNVAAPSRRRLSLARNPPETVANGQWSPNACVFAPPTHTRAHTPTYTHTHTQTNTCNCNAIYCRGLLRRCAFILPRAQDRRVAVLDPQGWGESRLRSRSRLWSQNISIELDKPCIGALQLALLRRVNTPTTTLCCPQDMGCRHVPNALRVGAYPNA
jgi:hypothetical protein